MENVFGGKMRKFLPTEVGTLAHPPVVKTLSFAQRD